jgi:hypothetical protein
VTLGQLVDRFDAPNPARWTYASDEAFVWGGRLQTNAQYTGPMDRAPGEAWTTAADSLVDSSVVVELVQIAAGTSTETYLQLYAGAAPDTDVLEFRVTDGFLTAQARVDGLNVVYAAEFYVPHQHRWLRIREDAGTVYWDTSLDGFGWANMTSWPVTSGIDLTQLHVLLGALVVSDLETFYVSPIALWDNLNRQLLLDDPVTLTGEGMPYLAVDVQPDNRAGTFALDISKLDEDDRLSWTTSDADAWLNVVCDVRSASYRRGATRLQGVLTQTEAGTMTVTLSDTLSAFDPMTNRDAIHKGTPLRIRGWGTDTTGGRWDAVLMTGEVDDVAVAYQREEPPLVTITGGDLVGPLAAWRAPGRELPGVGAGDDLGGRTQRVLDECGIGTVNVEESDSTFTATLAPSTLARPWLELNLAVEAELGRLWIDRHNRVVLRARGSELGGTIRGTLSDVHGEAPLGVHCCVADAAVVYGAENLTNYVEAGRRKPSGDLSADVVAVRVDDYSRGRYGPGSVERNQLELQTDEQVAVWAEAVVMSHLTPDLRVDSVTPAPSPVDLDSALEAWPAVLATELGDRWLFRYHPLQGPAVERAVGVLGIELTATPEGWTVQWTTADAPAPGLENPRGWFLLDISELDSPDLLAPFGVLI